VDTQTQDGEVDLVLSPDQLELAAVVRDFLDQRSPESTVRHVMETDTGIDEYAWTQMAEELGISGLAVPEDLGGGGGSFADVAVVLEELGRSLTCVPFFSSVVLAQSLLLATGDDEAKATWLPQLCSGATRATVAFARSGAPWDASGIAMSATRQPGGIWRLSGINNYVIDGHTAQVVFVLARTSGGLSIFAVEAGAPGMDRAPLPTMDLTRRQARLTFSDTPAQLVGAADHADAPFATMLDLAAVGISIESVGGAQRVLDMSVDYAKSRFQFGRAIGSFQAVKHKCTDMLLAVESARSAAYYARAVAAVGTDPAELAVAASMAKACSTDAYVMCASENIQVHGGIGFTWEHPAHLYFKRAKANQLMFGDPVTHRAKLAALLGI
jgi:alkylation response protein AidB-like acyl-CoA dehydrogenase